MSERHTEGGAWEKSDDRPLRVQVAEAMGKRCQYIPEAGMYFIIDQSDGSLDDCPDYGGPDWQATGEMLEWLEAWKTNYSIRSKNCGLPTGTKPWPAVCWRWQKGQSHDPNQ